MFDNCKYASCLQRSNVHLTDDPITAIQPRSIQTKSGQEYPADIIVSIFVISDDGHIPCKVELEANILLTPNIDSCHWLRFDAV